MSINTTVVNWMRSPSPFLSEIRNTLQLAVPLGGIQLAEASIGFINTVMMGLLGVQSLAAGALGAITFYTLTLICMGVAEGASPLAAEAFGANNLERIPRLLAQGMWLVVMVSLPMMLLTWNLDSILMLLGQEKNIVALSSTYLRAIVWGFPAATGFFIMKEIATALNRPQLISAIALISIPLNITANYLLIFGKLGLPALGLAGIGWASVCVFWVNFLAAAAILGFHPWFREYKVFSSLEFDRALFAELWRNGWPIGLQYASSLLVFTLIALISGYMGTTLLAANEIVVQILETSLIVPIAISYAAITRVGQMFGMNDLNGAKRAGFASITIGLGAITLVAVALWLFPQQIVSIYLDSNEIDHITAIKSAISLLRVGTFFLMAYGINVIAMGILMGIQDTRLPLLINIGFEWGIGIISGYLLCFHLNMGSIGLWLGLTLGVTLATVFLIYSFYRSISEMIQSSEDEQGLKETPILNSIS
jgi:MATE family multidrug resistance protein